MENLKNERLSSLNEGLASFEHYNMGVNTEKTINNNKVCYTEEQHIEMLAGLADFRI